MLRLFAILILCAGLLPAQLMKLTVGQLQSFIRSSIKLQHDDKKIADYLKKVALTEKLDERTIEVLIGEGAGPRTVNALRDLLEASVHLPKPPVERAPAPSPALPPPPAAEQKRILDEARDSALGYTKRLPDFICLQVTRRYADPSGMEFFGLQDTVVARLSYFEQKEDYKVVSIDGRLSEVAYDRLGGATSSGEFGTMLKEIFEPATAAEFSWERWGKLRGRVAHVYSYRVRQARSKWSVEWMRQQRITPGYRGFLYVDRDLPMILRVTLEAESIPASFPIQQAGNLLDYDFTSIAGQEYLLPLRAEMRMREGRVLVKNVVEFRNYRKFGAEAVITFETPDALPEEQFKEEKVEKPAPKK
jgi:hypothetical protein